jgi:hypothetical protein
VNRPEPFRGPDFFIVGAPKCGTTAMSDYLGQHPEIGMSAQKESQYFATDMRQRFAVKKGPAWYTPEEYLALFAGVQDRKRLGEASVWYLYSAAAPVEIERFCSKSRIIAMLRNPVDMIPSLHAEFVYNGIEPEEDLERALALDAERERRGAPPGFPPRSYRSAASYTEQLRRYFDVFGRERVHVILYDDFSRGTADIYRETCDFLDIDPGFVPEIRIVNPHKQARIRAVRGFLFHPPETFRRVLHAVTSREERSRVGSAIKRWNTRFVPRRPASEPVVSVLRPLAVRQARELGELLDRDLSAWVPS